MPELPEVETIRRGLVTKIKGLKIKKVEVLLPKQFQGKPSEVEGAKVLDIRRRGKINIIDLDNGMSLLIHLKLTGQLIFVENQHNTEHVTLNTPIPFGGGNTLPAKSTHIIFDFSDGSKLFYNDLRQFGWIKVLGTLSNLGDLDKLGPEPLDFARGKPFANKDFTVDYLQKIFAKTGKPVKLVLMEQEKIAGVGNIYANDALWEAGIMPTKSTKTLSEKEIKILREAIIKVLEEGIKYGGSTGEDEAYVNVEGNPGAYQKHFRVYQRKGEKCLRNDGGVIKRITLGGRGTFFCPACQR